MRDNLPLTDLDEDGNPAVGIVTALLYVLCAAVLVTLAWKLFT